VLVRIGSRGSRLALTQAEQAADALRRPGVEVAFVPITTAGDRDRTKPFGQIGERGVFVKEIEEALLAGRIDVAVHSAKDMTSSDTEGLAVGAYLERDDPRDALVGAARIEPGMRIGTASARRRAQLLALEPTLSIEPLRGNVDTRLRKLSEGQFDAIVLAQAGLERLGRSADGILDGLVPAAGQGALAIEARPGRWPLESLSDADAAACVSAERALTKALGASCNTPVAAHAQTIADGELELTAWVGLEDGSAWLRDRVRGAADQVGPLCAERMIAAGAQELL
jgi:hydroxymethylbilane synthase